MNICKEYKVVRPACLPIRGFEGLYTVYSDGSVRSHDRIDSLGRLRHGRFLQPKVLGKDRKHVCVCLHRDGRATYRQIHRLVAEAFIPNPLGKPTVNHINGVQNDNRVCNLEWATYQENQSHAWNTGLCKATKPKLTSSDAGVVRAMRESGSSYQKIAAHFNVDPKCIWQIINGKSYKAGRE